MGACHASTRRPETAVARLDESGGGWTVELSLEGSGAQCIALDPRDPETLYAGLRGGGVKRTTDGAGTWADCGLPADDVFSVAVSPVDGAVYAGTEPSALYRSDDGGGTWRELTALLDLPSRPTWSFPPRPWTSHVRWIAPSPHDAGLILAGIELGGLMRSTDGGESWQDQRPGSQPDVHSLAWHPHVEGRAYEAGGGGAAWSEDGGDTWRPADDGRDRHYTWSVAVDPVGSGPLVRLGEHRAVRGARPRRPAGARLPARERGLDVRSQAVFPIRSPRCRTRSSRRRTVSSPGSRTGSSGRAPTAATRGARASSAARCSTASSRSRRHAAA